MPRINISEVEETTFATFNASENTAVIPLLVARAFEKDGDYTEDTDKFVAVKYVDATRFRKDYLETACAGQAGAGSRVIYNTENTPDRSYIMAYELLLRGMNVVIKPIIFESKKYWSEAGRTIVSEDKYHELLEAAIASGALDEFKNKNGAVYNVKFITSGAYSNSGICSTEAKEKEVVADDAENFDEETQIRLADAKRIKPTAQIGETVVVVNEIQCTIGPKLAEIASTRGDAIAILELREKYNSDEELIEDINSIPADENLRFACITYPWYKATTVSYKNPKLINMPAGFGYLMAYANSVKSNANWFAASGAIRGNIPGLVEPVRKVSEALMHQLQGDEGGLNLRVNPIYDTGAYGIKIWGNRVAYPTAEVAELKYQDFLNVRILLCDLRKQIYHASMRTTFEPNDDILWLSFKSLTNSLLDQMLSGRGINRYKWIRLESTNKAQIKCALKIWPIEAVEEFDVQITLTDDIVEVEEL